MKIEKNLLTKELMFDNISLHLKNIFKDNELDESLVTEKSSITVSAGIILIKD